MDEAAGVLGAAIAGLIGTLSVRRVVVVGSMTAFGELWIEVVRASARGRALPLLAGRTDIEIGRMGDDAVLLGATALLLTRELGLLLLPDPAQAPHEGVHPDTERIGRPHMTEEVTRARPSVA